MTTIEALNLELKLAKEVYLSELRMAQQRIADAVTNGERRDSFSDHAGFNVLANISNAQVAAGKIEECKRMLSFIVEVR